ncbi:MAG: hypothetical protein IKM62_00275 [Kiritimatiellae bacterium]|nr:hypothetical protein [Kiritimatiellia bacterium]
MINLRFRVVRQHVRRKPCATWAILPRNMGDFRRHYRRYPPCVSPMLRFGFPGSFSHPRRAPLSIGADTSFRALRFQCNLR